MTKSFCLTLPTQLGEALEEACNIEEPSIPLECIGNGLGSSEYEFDNEKDRNDAVQALLKFVAQSVAPYDFDEESEKVTYHSNCWHLCR